MQLKNTIENQEKYSQEIIKRERSSSISEIIPVAKEQKIEEFEENFKEIKNVHEDVKIEWL